MSLRNFSVAQLLLSLILAAPSAPAGDLDATRYEVDLKENVEYGTGAGEKLTLHLATPRGIDKPVPGIVFIHGGGWSGGDKNMHKAMAKEAAAAGFVSASIGYRLAPKHRFPSQVEDVKCAVRWLRANADSINLDPSYIGAVGFSAGAHLSMMLGSMDSSDGLEGDGGNPDQSSKVQAVVSYFGPTDLADLDIGAHPARREINEPLVRGILETFIGGKAEEHADDLRRASPITYVNAGDAPMLLFHGTKDPLVPYDHAFKMVQALTDNKIPGRVELLLGKSHGWFGPELARTQSAALEFLNENLAAKPTKADK
jgi:acetyl esterase/lipase